MLSILLQQMLDALVEGMYQQKENPIDDGDQHQEQQHGCGVGGGVGGQPEKEDKPEHGQSVVEQKSCPTGDALQAQELIGTRNQHGEGEEV